MVNAMSADERALLAAILAHPDDDVSRLVYADWLDERAAAEPEYVPCPECNGTGEISTLQGRMGCTKCAPGPYTRGSGTVLDTGRSDRAEFVRVQCAIHSGALHGDLVRRERELLARCRAVWLPRCPACGPSSNGLRRDGLLPPCDVCSGTGHVGECRRGFVHSVTVPTLATVLVYNELPRVGDTDKRKWLSTEWAADHLAPFLPFVREVHCGDRATYTWMGAHYWGAPGWGAAADALPQEVFDGLKGHDPTLSSTVSSMKGYQTADAAHAAFATALADVLRGMTRVTQGE